MTIAESLKLAQEAFSGWTNGPVPTFTPQEAKQAAAVLARLEAELPKIGEELGRFCAWTAESEGYVTPTNAEIHYKTMQAILSRLDAAPKENE